MTESTLTRIDINGGNPAVALGRLELVNLRIDRRRDALGATASTDDADPDGLCFKGTPTEVHVWGDLDPLIEDSDTRAALEHIARHGARCGAVLLIHGEIEDIARALQPSRTLTTAFAAGAAVRHDAVPTPPSWSAAPRTDEEAGHWTESLSSEMWGALALGDVKALTGLFNALYAAGEGAAGPTQRRLLSDALRRTADTVLGGSGGMLGGVIPCPLCLSSPTFRADEIPGHLLKEHREISEAGRAMGAPGMRSRIVAAVMEDGDELARLVRQFFPEQSERYRIADNLSRAAAELRFEAAS